MSRSSKLLNTLRTVRDDESGFTLVELLIVMLILGLLAAIALPAFFNQKTKAGDAKAKEYVHTAQVTMETFATENGGKYTGATASSLETIEPSLKSIGTFTVTGPEAVASPTATEYKITVTATTGNTFAVQNKAGVITFPCTVSVSTNRGGCPSSGSWANG